MAKNNVNLTDNDLYCIALSIESHINHKDTFFTKKSAARFNRMINKVIKEGMSRKNPKAILHPIMNFDEGA